MCFIENGFDIKKIQEVVYETVTNALFVKLPIYSKIKYYTILVICIYYYGSSLLYSDQTDWNSFFIEVFPILITILQRDL